MLSLARYIKNRRYELLLFTLLLHLFNAVILINLSIYIDIFWPLDMLLLGIGSYGIFSERTAVVKVIKNILFSGVMGITILYCFTGIRVPHVMTLLTVVYVAFFIFIFIEVLRFLLKPGYINKDIVVASICGYLLLIEASLFLLQLIYYSIADSFKGIDGTNSATVFIDFVYYSTITLTSIGFGDILPTHYISKLLTAITGIAGQLYAVVLVGVIISKYTSAQANKTNH